MKTIPLSQGKVTIVDDGDFEELSKYKWCASYEHDNWYATRHVRRSNGSRVNYRMHRQIMGVSDPKVFIDHINGDGLNNQRSNLRVATCSQNGRNRGKTKDNASGWKGVSRDRNRWKARLRHEGKLIHGGHFDTPIAAAQAYNTLALRYHGEFARLNEV